MILTAAVVAGIVAPPKGKASSQGSFQVLQNYL